MSNLLSRYAGDCYWMARYLERVENMARILDVNETFSRDSRGTQNWQSIIQLYADDEDFAERYDVATAEAVTHFYLLDPENPSSVRSALQMARENARSLRPLISTEMWIQINMFHNWIQGLAPSDIEEHKIARLCARIKEACQTHTGITEGTFYRDAGWSFYQLGRLIERADQTTRMLDVKYHWLLPSPEVVGTPIDISQWNALLRTAAGFHAFRRVHHQGMSPATVSGFLLFNRNFPRSISACVAEMARLLAKLRSTSDLQAGATVLARLEALEADLAAQEIETVIAGGLHEYLDGMQLELISIGSEIARAFFGIEPEDVAETKAEIRLAKEA